MSRASIRAFLGQSFLSPAAFTNFAGYAFSMMQKIKFEPFKSKAWDPGDPGCQVSGHFPKPQVRVALVCLFSIGFRPMGFSSNVKRPRLFSRFARSNAASEKLLISPAASSMLTTPREGNAAMYHAPRDLVLWVLSSHLSRFMERVRELALEIAGIFRRSSVMWPAKPRGLSLFC
ncbi:hypothetical protein B0H66DRAFT_295283 [Apodospora peruviana]|uniref:Uncharacterized protein n=1 Tax=Apodospora peruviana TaxID=516989 RepID=A0AAE0M2K2_9PEZI|nr:hypothetical protein B0H66DRAFT_295283 [Apodospora peruviana]